MTADTSTPAASAPEGAAPALTPAFTAPPAIPGFTRMAPEAFASLPPASDSDATNSDAPAPMSSTDRNQRPRRDKDNGKGNGKPNSGSKSSGGNRPQSPTPPAKPVVELPPIPVGDDLDIKLRNAAKEGMSKTADSVRGVIEDGLRRNPNFPDGIRALLDNSLRHLTGLIVGSAWLERQARDAAAEKAEREAEEAVEATRRALEAQLAALPPSK